MEEPSDVEIYFNYIYENNIKGLIKMVNSNKSLLNSKQDDGLNGLSVACFMENIEIVDYFISLKIDSSATHSVSGNSCMHYSCQKGNKAITARLHEYNKSLINKLNNNGDNPLMFSCTNGNLKLIRYLISVGSDNNIINKSKTNCLFCSCESIHGIRRLYFR